ncbi:MAG: hypothetical protein IK079_04475, partial [Desulfovibrio sp.]|nr:hypothetical protein [Desulfovibrio sp.]
MVIGLRKGSEKLAPSRNVRGRLYGPFFACLGASLWLIVLAEPKALVREEERQLAFSLEESMQKIGKSPGMRGQSLRRSARVYVEAEYCIMAWARF